ncbi:MAG: preprotein translocase subunit SecA [Planctomycetes bacterium]|nr:preprotein translocase subunit SecA [Planctomycetota bacterium]
MGDSDKVSKDVELIERFGRWIGEKFEVLGERSGGVLRKVFRSRNSRLLDGYRAIVARIDAIAPQAEARSQAEMQAQTAAWKERLKGKSREEQAKILREILPEAFAQVREASKRAIGLRHFDVQLMGGVVLHEGRIAEMSTGEGKTLVSTCPAYLNALAGRGCFIVTVNDYLARRDADWMGKVHAYLGLTVGCIQSQMDPAERLSQYACDIVYGTNSEFGFDYLRDHMKSRAELQVQKQLHFAIIDEVDSILVDEARTPLIISGMPEQSTRKYYIADGVARRLKKDVHFEVKEKEHGVILTDDGIEEAQRLVGVPTFYDGPHMDWPHHIECALKAHNLYKLDVHYVKRPGEDGSQEIVIVDEFTGRMQQGRRWSDGLHQAVEAKEGIRIREENQTLATITYQNYFKLYSKIAGMTGTAITEAAEFSKIYNLDVVQIPTNRKNVRVDHDDVIYRSQKEKFPFVVQEIVEQHRLGRPVLVGTVSIEKSELLSRYLSDPQLMSDVVLRRAKHAEASLAKAKLPDDFKAELTAALATPARLDGKKARALADRVVELAPKADLAFWMEGIARAADARDAVKAGVPHNVLNAKFHEREAEIIAQAGRYAAVTIATNMAGRGTDILLGGNPEYLARTESRKLGAPERFEELLAQFKVQCEEEKQRVIAAGGLHVLGTERHEARRIDNQLRGRCARQGDPGSSRFYLSLEDDLMRVFANDRVQRILELVGMTEDVDIQSGMVSRSIRRAQKRIEGRNFDIRKNLLEYDEVMDKQRRTVYGLRQEVLEGADCRERVTEMIREHVERAVSTYIGEKPEAAQYAEAAQAVNAKIGTKVDGAAFFGREREELEKALGEAAEKLYVEREAELTPDMMRRLERYLLLNVIDTKWKDHLINLDALRSGIGLRSYGQIDPKNEYKKESFRMFEEMLASIGDEVLTLLYRLKPAAPAEAPSGARAVASPAQAALRPPVARPAPSAAAPTAAPTAAPAVAPSTPSSSAASDSAAAPSAAPAAAPTPPIVVPANLGRPAIVPQRPLAMPPAAPPASGATPAKPPARPAARNPAYADVGRNDPCPCGSGQKFKKCHGNGA